jgi:ribosome modulation factor
MHLGERRRKLARNDDRTERMIEKMREGKVTNTLPKRLPKTPQLSDPPSPQLGDLMVNPLKSAWDMGHRHHRQEVDECPFVTEELRDAWFDGWLEHESHEQEEDG